MVDEVVRTLSGAILSGELRPGDRLTVLPIAQEFGISQSTTREALLMLEQRGLVKTNPRRGTFVTRLSEVEAIELCRMRALVEAYTITVGGALIASDTLDALRQQVEAMGKCVLPKDMPQLIQHDLIFHQMIAELGGSELLLELWSSLSGRIGALILRSLEDKKLNVADVVRYHAEVIDALESREPEIGRRAIIQHYIRGQLNEQAQTDALSAVAQTTFALSAADAD
ncbi:MAG: GntR family transcriptional regulator [Caldilinea sp.]|nr:GntR family transcriptional regulator [Anaerolineae bacterium]MCB0024902.1 GntR family transcriptional regulator [Caldilinea sp.]MCB0068364.1 GntR family transcriptional regulator [Caldilineaceae bacterium]MCB0146186.1 GntR family transcriptional regulator [Caldilineaceae bacterium]MCW5843110.1 GntR family transcriptional regulator [Caldilinea sp.]